MAPSGFREQGDALVDGLWASGSETLGRCGVHLWALGLGFRFRVLWRGSALEGVESFEP